MKKKSNTVDSSQNSAQQDAQVGTSRRELLKGGAGVVAGVAMAQILPSEARAAQAPMPIQTRRSSLNFRNPMLTRTVAYY